MLPLLHMPLTEESINQSINFQSGLSSDATARTTMDITVKKCQMIMSGNDCWNSTVERLKVMPHGQRIHFLLRLCVTFVVINHEWNIMASSNFTDMFSVACVSSRLILGQEFKGQGQGHKIADTVYSRLSCRPWRSHILRPTPCLKKLCKIVFARTSSNFHQF